jgi:hypothetical protein
LVTRLKELCENGAELALSGSDPAPRWSYFTPHRARIREACDQIPDSLRDAKEASWHPSHRIKSSVQPSRPCASNRRNSLQKFTNAKLLNMQGGFLIRHSRLTALGIMLCLLVALFAVEAKIAWFSPAGSASAQISFAKARPAETPKMLSQGFVSPATPAHDFAGIAMLFAIAWLLASATIGIRRVVAARPQVCVSPGFTASLFFRPPPAL